MRHRPQKRLVDVTSTTIPGDPPHPANRLYGIKRALPVLDEHEREIKNILRKYDSEIVVSQEPLPLNSYVIHVERFAELLKLAVNLTKPIICYKDESSAEFSVIEDGYTFCYHIEIMPDEALDNEQLSLIIAMAGGVIPPHPPLP